MDIAKSAMLVSVSIKLEGLLGERRDRAASELVETTYSVEHRRAKASKYLIDRSHPKVKRVTATSQAVRACAYKYTFPWGDSNMRLLPSKVHDEFRNKLRDCVVELQAAIKDYVAEYPQLVAQSETALNDLFDASQYPKQAEVERMFKIGVSYWPMPESGHFVADIAQTARMEARALIEAETKSRVTGAINDLIERVETTVSAFVDKLATYSGKEGDKKILGIFRDSLVSNVADIGNMITKLNFTDDQSLNGLAVHVGRLARFTASSLRDNKDLRTSVVTEGKQLLAKLEAFKKSDDDVNDMVSSMSDYM